MKSRFLDFLFGYESYEEDFRKSGVARTEKNFSDKIIGGIGKAYSKRFLGSRTAKFLAGIRSALSGATLRSYGLLFLVFGLATLLLNFSEYYFRDLPDSPAAKLTIGSVFVIVAIPLLFFDIPIVEALSKNEAVRFLVFEVLCLRHSGKGDTADMRDARPIVPIVLGIMFAALGYLFPLLWVLLIIGILVFIALAISSPEFSFLMTLLFLPLIPALPMSTLILTSLVLITTVSFILKVLLGKRLYHFEAYDALMLLFMLFILVSGIFNNGFDSFLHAAVMLTLMLSYFVASNIIVNRRIAENAVRMIIFSSIPISVYGIITYYINPQHPEWIDPSFIGVIDGRAYATFGNPNVYAVFLVVTTILSVAFTVDRIKSKTVFYYAAASVLNVYSLIITWTRGAWLAIIISALAFIMIRSRRCPKLLLIPALILPVLFSFIPTAVMERFLSIFGTGDSSISSRLSIWRSSIDMFLDNLFVGVGIGTGSFSKEFLLFAEDSVTAPHSHNLFLEIGCEAGIFALLLFIFLLLVRIRHRASYAKYVRGSSVDNLSTVTGTAVFGLLVYGMTDYIWYSPVNYTLFWIIFGIGSSALRIAKAEHDELGSALIMESFSDAAQIDIAILDQAENKK